MDLAVTIDCDMTLFLGDALGRSFSLLFGFSIFEEPLVGGLILEEFVGREPTVVVEAFSPFGTFFGELGLDKLLTFTDFPDEAVERPRLAETSILFLEDEGGGAFEIPDIFHASNYFVHFFVCVKNKSWNKQSFVMIFI